MKRSHDIRTSGDESDAFGRWKRWLCVFYNNTGLGKKAKRSYNKRARRQAKSDLMREMT